MARLQTFPAQMTGLDELKSLRNYNGQNVFVELADWSKASAELTSLRASVAPELGLFDDSDEVCPHFLVYRADALVGALRVNFADEAPFDFEAILPMAIPNGCRHELLSVSRLVVAKTEICQTQAVIKAAVRAACVHAWPLGKRAALFAAPIALTNLYRRTVAAAPVSKAAFHPRTGREVRILAHIPKWSDDGIMSDLMPFLSGPPISTSLVKWFRELERCN